MFANLPEEIERYIWKLYFSGAVKTQINSIKSIWINPSDQILNICRDVGCLQHGHSELEKILFEDFDEKKQLVNACCFKEVCGNCEIYGFPCLNATIYGGFDERLTEFWKI